MVNYSKNQILIVFFFILSTAFSFGMEQEESKYLYSITNNTNREVKFQFYNMKIPAEKMTEQYQALMEGITLRPYENKEIKLDIPLRLQGKFPKYFFKDNAYSQKTTQPQSISIKNKAFGIIYTDVRTALESGESWTVARMFEYPLQD